MKNRTVLYVEDEENDVFLMQMAWENGGLPNALKVAADGEEAVAYLAGDGRFANRDEYPLPCLVLLDLKLPKLSGLDVLQWIRQRPAFCTLRVVVVSSSNRPLDIHTAYARGANAYVVKPSRINDLNELAATLKEFWLNRAETPPECLQFKEELLVSQR